MSLKGCFDANNKLMQEKLAEIESFKKSIKYNIIQLKIREAREKITDLEEFKSKSQTQQNNLIIE